MKPHFVSFLVLLFFSGATAFAQDVLPPVMNSIYLGQDTVQAGDSVTVYLDITDDISGPLFANSPGYTGGYATAVYIDSVGSVTGNGIGAGKWFWVSGNLYYTKIKIPTTAMPGNWMVTSLLVCDYAINTRTYPYNAINLQFYVSSTNVNTNTDHSPPTVYSIAFNSHVVYSDSIITAYINAFDSSGFAQVSASISSASPPWVHATLMAPYDSVVGNMHIQHFHIPRWAVGGQWHVDNITAQDSAHNTGYYYPNSFSSDSFTVIATSPDTVMPTINTYQFSPAIAHRGDTVTLVFNTSDNLSGIYTFHLSSGIASTTSNQQQLVQPITDLGNGNFIAKTILSEYAANGVWMGTLTVADSAGNTNNLFVDTAFIILPDSNITITGNALQSNGTPLANSKVFMVKENPTDSLLYVMRVANTDSMGKYIFHSARRDSLFYLKAIPIDTIAWELPTYYDNAALFTSAILLQIDTASSYIMNTIYTMAGTNTGGFGFVIGYINQGAGKTGAVGDPKQNLGLVLVDSLGNFVAGTVTDSTGHFRFSHLADGIYSLYTDLPKINNNIAPTITIDGSHPNANVLNFSLHERYLERVIDAVEELKEGSLTIAPNPSTGMCVMILDASITGHCVLEIYNTLGETVSTSTIVSDGSIQYRAIDLSAATAGVYLAKLTTPQGVKTVKFVKE